MFLAYSAIPFALLCTLYIIGAFDDDLCNTHLFLKSHDESGVMLYNQTNMYVQMLCLNVSDIQITHLFNGFN